MDKKSRSTFSNGWSLKNLSVGLSILIVGYLLFYGDGFLAFTATQDSSMNSSPFGLNLLYWLSLILIAFGPLGFWLVIPAFQKWWRTKDRWLAWTFLGIAIVLSFIFALHFFRS